MYLWFCCVAAELPLHYVGGDGCCGHQLTDNPSYFQSEEIRRINAIQGETTTHLPHWLCELCCLHVPAVVDRKSLCIQKPPESLEDSHHNEFTQSYCVFCSHFLCLSGSEQCFLTGDLLPCCVSCKHKLLLSESCLFFPFFKNDLVYAASQHAILLCGLHLGTIFSVMRLAVVPKFHSESDFRSHIYMHVLEK